MSKPCRALDHVRSTEDIINQIYSTAYRLTGQRRGAEALVIKALKTTVKRKNKLTAQAALEDLCVSFMQNNHMQNNHPAAKQDFKTPRSATSHRVVNAEQVQKALLYLEPVERLVLLLREMWRLSYGEIAHLTGLNKEKVAEVLARGRRRLRDYLFTPGT